MKKFVFKKNLINLRYKVFKNCNYNIFACMKNYNFYFKKQHENYA